MKHTHSHIPLLIFAIIIVLLVTALYGYMFQATSVSVDKALLSMSAVAAEESDNSQTKTFLVMASSTETNRDKLSSRFVSSEDIVSFITVVEAMGPESGSSLSITSIDADPLTGAVPGTLGHARAHIDAHGSWGSVMRLLALAENMPYAVSVSHVRLNNSGDNAKVQSAWSVAFDIQVSIIVPPKSPDTK